VVLASFLLRERHLMLLLLLLALVDLASLQQQQQQQQQVFMYRRHCRGSPAVALNHLQQ
jgi:hypothetical protein